MAPTRISGGLDGKTVPSSSTKKVSAFGLPTLSAALATGDAAGTNRTHTVVGELTPEALGAAVVTVLE
jgi:hypothetical protein